MNMLGSSLIILGITLALLIGGQLILLLFTAAGRLRSVRLNEHRDAALFRERMAEALLRLHRQESHAPWNGTRKFTVERIVEECRNVKSFYLAPHDRKAISSFQPGQYLTFDLDVPGQKNRVVRCYSLSDCPRPDFYRVTIKRIPPPPDQPDGRPGLASGYFHDALKVGDLLDVRAPAGGFYLDMSRNHPVVLIGAGIGITPVLSMLNEIVEHAPHRETWFFFGVQNGEDQIMKLHLKTLAREKPNIHLHVCYSRPTAKDVAGDDYQHSGRVSLALLKQVLPSNNFDFLVCGPGEMMSSLQRDLMAWGVPATSIHMEAFGPASVKRTAPMEGVSTHTPIDVSFARSQKSVRWDGQFDSLLDLALAENVPMGFGCRAGSCGTCKTAIKSGSVKYLKESGCEVEAGSCLPCICIPHSALILDA